MKTIVLIAIVILSGCATVPAEDPCNLLSGQDYADCLALVNYQRQAEALERQRQADFARGMGNIFLEAAQPPQPTMRTQCYWMGDFYNCNSW